MNKGEVYYNPILDELVVWHGGIGDIISAAFYRFPNLMYSEVFNGDCIYIGEL